MLKRRKFLQFVGFAPVVLARREPATPALWGKDTHSTAKYVFECLECTAKEELLSYEMVNERCDIHRASTGHAVSYTPMILKFDDVVVHS